MHVQVLTWAVAQQSSCVVMLTAGERGSLLNSKLNFQPQVRIVRESTSVGSRLVRWSRGLMRSLTLLRGLLIIIIV